MSETRTAILEWIAQGRLRPQDVPGALRQAGVTPEPGDWRNFLDHLTLWLGTVSCGAAVIFFFAYNWQEMGRLTKFGLVQLLLVGSLAFCWRLGVSRAGGKAALLLASLLTGALLALVGQTYQTGADPWQLFAAWALAILPWALVGRFNVLWLLWIGLLNLAGWLYLDLHFGSFRLFSRTNWPFWMVFCLNASALLVWEGAARIGVEWLRARWPQRILATVAGFAVTWLALDQIVGSSYYVRSAGGVLAYTAWTATAFFFYRRVTRDLFMLAGGVLSLIVVATAFLGKHMLGDFEAGALLVIGLVVIAMSAAGGFWLKSVASEVRA